MKKLFIALLVLCASCTQLNRGRISKVILSDEYRGSCYYVITWSNTGNSRQEQTFLAACDSFQIGDTVKITKYGR